MKKKLLSFIFAICLIIPCAFMLTACGGGGNDTCDGDHTQGDLLRTEAATCEEYGKKIYECQNCKKEYAVDDYSVQPLGHTYEDDINCTTCDKEYVDTNLKFKLNDTQDGYIVAWHYDEEAVSEYPYNGDYSAYCQENLLNKDAQQSIINIPAEYNGLPVVEVAQASFIFLLDENFEVVMGENLDPISGGTNPGPLLALTHYIKIINIPSSVKKIGEFAFGAYYSGANFRDMDVPTAVYLNEGLVEIGDSAFQSVEVEDVTIPSTVTTIGQGAFNGTRLKSVEIPSNVSYVGEDAFPGGLLSATINSNPNNMTSFSLPSSVNTIINNTSETFTKDDAENWINGTVLDYFDFREEDINYKKAISALGRDSLNGEDKDIDAYIYYTNINGENYLTDVYTKHIWSGPSRSNRAIVTEMTIPEGITHIKDVDIFNQYPYERTFTLNLPDSLQVIKGYFYSNSLGKTFINISDSTDVTNFNWNEYSNDELIVRQDATRHVKLDYLELIDLFNQDNNYTLTKNGIKFELSSVGGIGEVEESVNYEHNTMHADFEDLEIVVSFVDGNETRVAKEIIVSAKDSYQIGDSHTDFNAYYYDENLEQYVHFEPHNSDKTFNQTDPEPISHETAEGQSQWKLTLDINANHSSSDNGVHIEYIELTFEYEIPKYNGDLTIKTNN